VENGDRRSVEGSETSSKQDAIGEQNKDESNDEEAQVFVQRLIAQGIYSIAPKIDTKGISYPLLFSLFPNKSDLEVKDFLRKLVQNGTLVAKLLDKVVTCPTCGSPSVYSKYNCPRCSSFNIGKTSIIEHVRCGFIGSVEKFQKADEMICPKCKSVISDADYKQIGTSFECDECNSRFESPKVSHKCNSCEEVFTFREAKYESICEYALSEEAKRGVAKGTVPLAAIADVLTKLGFNVKVRSDIVGKSGATHTFDIVARKLKVLVVANFTFEPKEEDIIGLFAKKYDTDPTLTLLISVAPPSREQEAVSRTYGVVIISSTSLASVGERIQDLLGKQRAVPDQEGQEKSKLKS
jgi:Thaumarchaeal output domain 1